MVGVGGLGGPAALALAAAGIGHLRLIDDDSVDVSNLHRQLLFRDQDLGKPKVSIAATRLHDRHPQLGIEAERQRLTAANRTELLSDCDLVIDGSDNVATKFCINDGLTAAGRPFVHAGVTGWLGQVLAVVPGRSACVRCIFPEVDGADEEPACQVAGVVGPLPALIGSMQASEAIRLLSGDLEAGRLIRFDGWRFRWQLSRVAADPDCASCGSQKGRRADSLASFP